MSSRLPAAVASLVCLGWLTLTTGYAAAAAPSDPIDLGGQKVPGGASTDLGNPKGIAPGLWRATLEGSLPHYYTYERRISGSTVWIGVVGAPQSTDSDELKVEASVESGDGDETSCGDDNDTSDYSLPHAVLGGSVIVGNEDSTTGQACRGAAEMLITVGRGNNSNPADLPYAIKVVEEAPVSSGGGEEDEDVTYDVPEPGSASETPGSDSFEDAPKIDARSGKVTISATITEGTELLWRVPLSWGDLPVVRVDVPEATGDDAETFSYDGPDLALHLVDPLRSRYTYLESGSEDSTTGEYRAWDDADGDVLVTAGLPVRRANGHLPGDNWISLVAQAPTDSADQEPVDIPVEITVDIGSVDGAEPTYDKAVLSQDKGQGPGGYSPDKPYLVADDTFSAVASGNPIVSEDDEGGWLNARHGAGLGLAVVSVACLAGGLVRLRARR